RRLHEDLSQGANDKAAQPRTAHDSEHLDNGLAQTSTHVRKSRYHVVTLSPACSRSRETSAEVSRLRLRSVTVSSSRARHIEAMRHALKPAVVGLVLGLCRPAGGLPRVQDQVIQLLATGRFLVPLDQGTGFCWTDDLDGVGVAEVELAVLRID